MRKGVTGVATSITKSAGYFGDTPAIRFSNIYDLCHVSSLPNIDLIHWVEVLAKHQRETLSKIASSPGIKSFTFMELRVLVVATHKHRKTLANREFPTPVEAPIKPGAPSIIKGMNRSAILIQTPHVWGLSRLGLASEQSFIFILCPYKNVSKGWCPLFA